MSRKTSATAPDGNGKSIWKLDDRRVPYRWPEFAQVSRRHGFCNGRREGRRSCCRSSSFAPPPLPPASGLKTVSRRSPAATLSILEDNDDAGRKKALEAAQPRCTAPQKVSASLRCQTYRTKATCPIGWTAIQTAPKNLLIFVCMRRCGRLPTYLTCRFRQSKTRRREPKHQMKLNRRNRAQRDCRLSICRTGITSRSPIKTGSCRTGYRAGNACYFPVRARPAKVHCNCICLPRMCWRATGSARCRSRGRRSISMLRMMKASCTAGWRQSSNTITSPSAMPLAAACT